MFPRLLGFPSMHPRETLFKWSNLVRFKVQFAEIYSLKHMYFFYKRIIDIVLLRVTFRGICHIGENSSENVFLKLCHFRLFKVHIMRQLSGENI